MLFPIGFFKQEILKEYNVINQSIFGIGVKAQSVEFINNKIIFSTHSGRPEILRQLDEYFPSESLHVNQMLIQIFKEKIKEVFEQKFDLDIVAVFKDYDVRSEHSITVIVLDGNVDKMFE